MKINKAVIEMTKNFNLEVNENGIGVLLEVVPEELTRTGTQSWKGGKRKGDSRGERTSRRFAVKALAEAFAGLSQLL